MKTRTYQFKWDDTVDGSGLVSETILREKFPQANIRNVTPLSDVCACGNWVRFAGKKWKVTKSWVSGTVELSCLDIGATAVLQRAAVESFVESGLLSME